MRLTAVKSAHFGYGEIMSTNVCADCAVRDRALCGSLSDGELQTLNRLGQRRALSAGETLVWAEDESRLCANVLSGVLKLVGAAADGREQIVGLLYPSDFVGEPFAGSAPFTVRAVSDCTLCVFPQAGFEEALARFPGMEKLLLQRTLAALSDARSRMFSLSRGSTGSRVAAFLLEMAERADGGGCRAAPGGPVTFDLPLSRQEIADVLGTTIESVSRQMTRLRDEGVIALPGGRGVTLSDPIRLKEMAAA
ncbi:Crp/Fnr family transcriptional regulator [Sphingomonas sp. ID0503]|uniref:Crp/Fnr family transcriptional regulator n=1 Tax=Sphingomonas sp. ID0503 TaxID=3399691 RepID=UPI003AFB1C14